MKKDLSKILIVVGLIVVLVGFFLDGMINRADNAKEIYEDVYLITMPTGIITDSAFWDCVLVAIVCAFALSKNQAFVNMGYILGAVAGVLSVVMFPNGQYMKIVALFGMIVMLVAAVIYFVSKMLSFFGFVKANTNKTHEAVDLLTQYKQMQESSLITTDEFFALKQKLFRDAKPRMNSFDDLKKWKLLLDQDIITEEEFLDMKSNLF